MAAQIFVRSVPRSPGDFIRDELAARGWTQADLARIINRPLPTVNQILQGKKAVLPEMAIALGVAFGNGSQVWMDREVEYRLSLTDVETDSVERNARLYNLVPVAEIQKRNWIAQGDDVEMIESEVCKFLEIASVSEEPSLMGALRRSNPDAALTPPQRAWCFRVRQLSRTFAVPPYDPSRLVECVNALRKVAAYPKQAHKVPSVLAAFGIKLVIVEPPSKCKVDGAAMWVDGVPVIGMSVRYDRVDAFWFTLGHELSHVRHRDEMSFDSDLAGQDQVPSAIKNPIERRADEEGAELLVQASEIESFVRRVAPLYSKQKIIQFAHRIKVHPGIIVGQLQFRGEIGYSANREMLSKVRSEIAGAALTDGYGHSIGRIVS